MNQEHGQFVIDTPLMFAGLAYGLRQRYDDIPKEGRWRTRSFPGRKGQHISGFIATAKGSIQATHPVVAHNFEAEEGLAFTDGLENTIGELPESREAQLSPRQPHADHDRH
ncbi:MAG TPA: hypothetical protein PLR85_07140 [Nitrospira sp.]|nr:hypothetical protein [Nitrospira sp.]